VWGVTAETLAAEQDGVKQGIVYLKEEATVLTLKLQQRGFRLLALDPLTLPT